MKIHINFFLRHLDPGQNGSLFQLSWVKLAIESAVPAMGNFRAAPPFGDSYLVSLPCPEPQMERRTQDMLLKPPCGCRFALMALDFPNSTASVASSFTWQDVVVTFGHGAKPMAPFWGG